MRVRVTRSMNGSPGDTPNVAHRYQAGKVYGPDTTPPMPANLSEVFLREGWALEEKALAAAPENKMLDGAGENKADDQDGAPATPPSGTTTRRRTAMRTTPAPRTPRDPR